MLHTTNMYTSPEVILSVIRLCINAGEKKILERTFINEPPITILLKLNSLSMLTEA